MFWYAQNASLISLPEVCANYKYIELEIHRLFSNLNMAPNVGGWSYVQQTTMYFVREDSWHIPGSSFADK